MAGRRRRTPARYARFVAAGILVGLGMALTACASAQPAAPTSALTPSPAAITGTGPAAGAVSPVPSFAGTAGTAPPESPTLEPSPAATMGLTPTVPVSTTGTITGIVTNQTSGAPISQVYITVGYQGLQRAAITGADGRYTVSNVPSGQPADVFGFHGAGYRYHNSLYDDHLHITLQPGQVYTYSFTVYRLNDLGGEPQVIDPSIAPDTATPGQTVVFGLTARGGKGGLSDEVIAASPALGHMVLLKPAGGDRFRGSFTVPPGTPPGDYPFAFFAASNDCYDNEVFPMLTLHVMSGP